MRKLSTLTRKGKPATFNDAHDRSLNANKNQPTFRVLLHFIIPFIVRFQQFST